MVGARPVGAARSDLRLGHLRRRRQRRRGDHRRAACNRRGYEPAARRSSDRASGAPATRSTRRSRATGTPASRTSSRCAATCPEGAPFEPHPGGYASSIELIEAVAPSRPVRDQRRRLPRAAPRFAVCRQGSRVARAQGRRGRDPRDHAVLLRHRRDREAARPDRSRRHRPDARTGDHAGDQLRRCRADGEPLQRRHPGLAGGPFRGTRRRSPDADDSSPRSSRPSRSIGCGARASRSSTSTRSTYGVVAGGLPAARAPSGRSARRGAAA